MSLKLLFWTDIFDRHLTWVQMNLFTYLLKCGLQTMHILLLYKKYWIKKQNFDNLCQNTGCSQVVQAYCRVFTEMFWCPLRHMDSLLGKSVSSILMSSNWGVNVCLVETDVACHMQAATAAAAAATAAAAAAADVTSTCTERCVVSWWCPSQLHTYTQYTPSHTHAAVTGTCWNPHTHTQLPLPSTLTTVCHPLPGKINVISGWDGAMVN